jgi:tetratricopeptide (TPR) repeat protein
MRRNVHSIGTFAANLPETVTNCYRVTLVVRGRNALARDWKSTDPYPVGVTFGELLDWHLSVWGTNEKSTRAEQSDPWVLRNFAALVHSGLPPTEEENNPERKLWNWRFNVHLPKEGRVTQNIFDALFGDNPALADWKRDLREALDRERAEKRPRPERPESSRATANGVPRPPVYFVKRNEEVETLADYEAYAATELGIRRDLLEVLALRFGHQSPDDPDISLLDFLKRKAREYHELKSRISQLAGSESQLSNILGAAQGALDQGKFGEASELLKSAEDSYQNNKTIEAIKGQYEIRVARGKAALLSGSLEEASQHFERAASFFHVFDQGEEAWSRIDLANLIIDEGPWMTGQSRYYGAYKLLEPTLTLFEEGTKDWAFARYHMGKLLCGGYDQGSFFDERRLQGIDYLLSASSIIGKDAYPEHTIDTFQVISETFCKLARDEAKQGNITAALQLVQDAKGYEEQALAIAVIDLYPRDWLESRVQLSFILSFTACETAGESGIGFASKAIDLIESTFEHHEIMPEWVIWLNLLSYYLVAIETIIDRSSERDVDDLVRKARKRIDLEKEIIEEQAPGMWASSGKSYMFSIGKRFETAFERLEQKASKLRIR